MSLDFDEIESSGRNENGAAEDDSEDEFGFSFDTADEENADASNASNAAEDVETIEAIETIDSIDDVDDVDDADNTDNTDNADDAPVPQTQYARRVYRMRLKRAAKRHDEDQAILDALRAAYDEDDDDDDLTQHEYDQYHYTFDSGKK